MPKVINTIPEFSFYLKHDRCITEGTLINYKQMLRYFCDMFAQKEAKDLLPTDVHKFKRKLTNTLRARKLH